MVFMHRLLNNRNKIVHFHGVAVAEFVGSCVEGADGGVMSLDVIIIVDGCPPFDVELAVVVAQTNHPAVEFHFFILQHLGLVNAARTQTAGAYSLYACAEYLAQHDTHQRDRQYELERRDGINTKKAADDNAVNNGAHEAHYQVCYLPAGVTDECLIQQSCVLLHVIPCLEKKQGLHDYSSPCLMVIEIIITLRRVLHGWLLSLLRNLASRGVRTYSSCMLLHLAG